MYQLSLSTAQMTKREDIQQRRLESLESEFRSLLPRVLKECAAGRWGLFVHNDGDGGKYLFWPEADQLKTMAIEIRLIRESFGESNSDVERFLRYCSLRGSNLPGEPRLAQSLLDEVESSLSGRPSNSE